MQLVIVAVRQADRRIYGVYGAYRYIYNTEGFTVIASVSRSVAFSAPGPPRAPDRTFGRIGYGRQEGKNRYRHCGTTLGSPRCTLTRWWTRTLSPIYKRTAFQVKEVRASGELGRPAGARNGEAQNPGAGSIQSDGSWLPRIDRHHPWLQRQDSVVDTV